MKALSLVNTHSRTELSTQLAYLHIRNSIYEWDVESDLKKNAIKEIQKALRLFRMKGTIDL